MTLRIVACCCALLAACTALVDLPVAFDETTATAGGGDELPVVIIDVESSGGGHGGEGVGDGGDAQPEVLTALPEDRPWGIAVDDDYVYWTSFYDGAFNSGSIRFMRHDTSDLPHDAALGVALPMRVVIADDYVYWLRVSNAGAVVRTLRGLVEPPKEVLASSQLIPGDLVIVDDHVLWTAQGTGVLRAPVSLGIIETVIELPAATGLAVRGGFLYVGNSAGIRRVALSDLSQPADIVAVTDTVFEIAAADDVVYWTTVTGQLYRLPLTPGAQAKLIYSGHAFGVEVDDGHVYWSDTGPPGTIDQGSIHRERLDGSGRVLVASKQSQPRFMAIHGPHLYWASSGVNDDEGRIMRVVR